MNDHNILIDVIKEQFFLGASSDVSQDSKEERELSDSNRKGLAYFDSNTRLKKNKEIKII